MARTKTARLWGAGMLVAALAAVLAGSMACPAGAAGTASAAGCSVPVTHDPWDGYHVGVPAGWSVFRVSGRLVVTPTGTSPEQSIVAPALLTNGLTAARYFASSMQSLDKQIVAGGNAMRYRITSSSGGIPQATLSGRAGKTPVTGSATVLVLPDRTAHGSQVAVLSAYWAPATRLGADRGKLAAVALCYGPEPAPLFQVFHDQVFTYAMPPGFKVTAEGQDNLLIAKGNDASASFLLTLLTPASGVDSVQALQQYIFAHENIKVTRVLASSLSPRQSAAGGAVAQLEDIEFLGVLNGSTPVHGIAAVYASVGTDIGGTMRLALTKTALWNGSSGAVIRIAAGVQHSFAQDTAEWERLSRQQQAFGQQVTGFDEALNGEDLVRDPGTGQTFEAPYQSYLKSGPDGPGYYAGSTVTLHKLDIITPE